MPSEESFAIRLMRAQSAANLRQTDLATASGLRKSIICQLQQGKCNPSYETLIKLAQTLNVSTDYLCGLESK